MVTHSSVLAWRIPGTGGAWWAAMYGVAESRTQLKRLSSSSSLTMGFPDGSDVKASACSAGDLESIPGLGRSPGGGHGNPLQCSRLENPMDRGAWWAAVYGVAQSQTRLTRLSSSSTPNSNRKRVQFKYTKSFHQKKTIS